MIVGIGGLLSDPSCCVLKNGQLASAVEQSKLARRERPDQFPQEAFSIALQAADVEAAEIDCVAIARPFSRGRRVILSLSFARVSRRVKSSLWSTTPHMPLLRILRPASKTRRSSVSIEPAIFVQPCSSKRAATN